MRDKTGYIEGARKRTELFRKRNKSKNSEILRLYNLGNSMVEIEKIIGIARSTISRRLGEMGIDIDEREKRGYDFMVKKQMKNREINQKEINAKILSMYKSGKLIKEISKEVNLDINTLTKRLDKLGTTKEERIKRGTRAGVKLRSRVDILDETIKELYLNKNMSSIKIANMFNCSSTLVLERLKLLKVPRRNVGGVCNPYSIKKKSALTIEEKAERRKNFSEKRKRLFAEGKLIPPMLGNKHSAEAIIKIKARRALQVFPKKDTSIELKIQFFLTNLQIEYFTHKYINEITHAYQCDIFIPVQEGIPQKTIIECDGDYWHGNRELFAESKLSERILHQRELDNTRQKELEEKGFRVVRLWGSEIKKMGLDDFNKTLQGEVKLQ